MNMNEIILNLTTSEKRAAILENGKVVEILIERPDAYPKAGNIYFGRVVKVLPGIQAAFINIGFEQNGFIHSTDLINEDTGKPINELVHEGQMLIVQVKREASKNKGPLLTENITIPGVNLVYLPFSGYIALSKKLSDVDKDKVKVIGEKLTKAPEGLIMRTSSASTDAGQLGEEISELRTLWNSILAEAKGKEGIGLLYEGNTIVETALNHIQGKNTKLIFDDMETYTRYRNTVDAEYEAAFYRGVENIFSYYQIEPILQKALSSSVWLKNGGHIQIDTTEALTVIDVNTGKFTGKQNRERSVLETNLLAAEEAAKQLRLRNMSGMFVIDFIRMSDEDHRLEVENRLKEALSADPIQTRVYGFTALGLMELTRQKVRDSLSAILTEECTACTAAHRQLSVKTMYFSLERALYELRKTDETGVWIEMSSRLYTFVKEEAFDREDQLSSLIPAKLYLTEKHVSDGPDFKIRHIGRSEDIEARIDKELR